jgi:hypothetical protein
MGGYIDKPTQEKRILKLLEDANGEWVDGQRIFLHQEYISQYHARIWNLQKQGYAIEGRFIKDGNWKEYRLMEKENLPKIMKCSVCKKQLYPNGECLRCDCGIWVHSKKNQTEWVFNDAQSVRPTLRFII